MSPNRAYFERWLFLSALIALGLIEHAVHPP